MYAILLGNLWLYQHSPLPLWIHVGLAAVAIHFAFTIWHEAAHLNVSSNVWVNRVIGVLGMFPYMTPYFMQRWIHLRHHAYLNQPDDPNVVYTDGSFSTIIFRYPRAIAYAKKVMTDDPRSNNEKISDTVVGLVLLGVILTATFTGHFWTFVILWALPLVIAKLVMDWYVNYLPHAGLPADRFAGTRVVDANWFTPLVLVHNYHAIHHLWPNIPWHRYRSTFREKRDYLVENGVPITTSLLKSGAHSRSTSDTTVPR